MKEKFARFMSGRNGNDQFNLFLLISGAVFIILSTILKKTFLGSIFSLAAVAAIVFCYVRMLSRNISKRRSENEKYLAYKYKVLAKFRVLKESWVQRKEYKFFSCPSCHTTLRVPRGRGKIRIVCRKCGTSFTGKS